MAQYIDKSALIAEIDRWIKLLTNEKNQEGSSQIDKLSLGGRIAELQEVKVFLNTLEVKEVDLEKELNVIIDSLNDDKYEHLSIHQQLSHIAKHFFELGLKAKEE
jgi:hypothetical protein